MDIVLELRHLDEMGATEGKLLSGRGLSPSHDGIVLKGSNRCGQNSIHKPGVKSEDASYFIDFAA